MTAIERSKVGEYWLGLSQMYGRELPRTALKIMLDSVADLPAKEIIIALEEWSKNSKINRHPLPGEVRDILKKELSPDAKANEAANRIRMAISNYGWPDADGARRFIGELGWSVVLRFGGWGYICENHGLELNPLTFHAQARDSAKSILESARLGQFDRPIQIDHKSESKKTNDLLEFINRKGDDDARK